MVRERTEQPLVSAGWGALLVLMFLALVLASASGVMLFSFTDTRERRTEFALLRTLGSSRGQLNGAVWFSLFVVTLFGVVLGSVAGQVIGTSLLPLMEVAEEGARVTPAHDFGDRLGHSGNVVRHSRIGYHWHGVVAYMVYIEDGSAAGPAYRRGGIVSGRWSEAGAY